MVERVPEALAGIARASAAALVGVVVRMSRFSLCVTSSRTNWLPKVRVLVHVHAFVSGHVRNRELGVEQSHSRWEHTVDAQEDAKNKRR